ncbi:ARL14 effector protein isoform X1 [Scleropages formosus]|uniref:ADP-ribosylation factor-like 14 effector protein n=1 Tax=Scleropages formosus TaxID=113540 RepID=A0A8C9TSV9_SCLFO|nr:ARL14 effector protein isoform X1 [Scleropages formosus]
MPVSCSAMGCTNRFVKGSEIRFYRFPISKPQLVSQWVQSLGRKSFVPTANSCLCSEHFEPDCFRDYNGRQFLREDAVPTIFAASISLAGPDTSKIELRKNRGCLTKDTNKSPAIFSGLTEREKEKEGDRAKLRAREKRQTLKDTNSTNLGKAAKALKSLEFTNPGRQTDFSSESNRRDKRRVTKSSDRHSMGVKSKVYDSQGLLITNGRDMCDCLDVDCMGCFYPCPECNSRKCGVECRCDRKWLYEQVEVEGGEIIRNKYAN